MASSSISRRAFLAGGLASWALASHGRAAQVLAARVPFSINPFTLGVASGDPTPTGVVLWTRLAVNPLDGGGLDPVPVRVAWELARDDRMRTIVRQGEATAVADWAHSVHVEVEGLEPDRWYWYRFHAGGQTSMVGRTRTLPAAAAAVSRLRFGFVSCQNYELGYFTALRHAAAEDLDLMFHLGDFLYEYAARPDLPRAHRGPELTTLALYRNRYAQYRTDPDLQAAHAVCPWVVSWDDHEVENNYAADRSEWATPVRAFLDRRAAAYKAFYEHMPLRTTSMPQGAFARLYRGFSYGTLAAFSVLDTRQYRSDQPCGDGVAAPCPEMARSTLTMLGADQERWLTDRLIRSRVRWNVIPQQVMMARVDLAAGPEVRVSMDQWSGYDAARTRLLSFLGAAKPANPVVLTGDVHNSWVNDLKPDFVDPRSPVVATELVGTSVTSGGDGQDQASWAPRVLSENPFVKFHNDQRGYVRCELTPRSLRADFRVVEYVSTPGARVSTRASFIIEDGRSGASRLA